MTVRQANREWAKPPSLLICLAKTDKKQDFCSGGCTSFSSCLLAAVESVCNSELASLGMLVTIPWRCSCDPNNMGAVGNELLQQLQTFHSTLETGSTTCFIDQPLPAPTP